MTPEPVNQALRPKISINEFPRNSINHESFNYSMLKTADVGEVDENKIMGVLSIARVYTNDIPSQIYQA